MNEDQIRLRLVGLRWEEKKTVSEFTLRSPGGPKDSATCFSRAWRTGQAIVFGERLEAADHEIDLRAS